jgi:hypothetical protein
MHRRRAVLASPRAQQRAAWICFTMAVAIAIGASWWRGSTRPGSGARSATYLLDVLAILIGLASAFFEARVANLLADFPAPSLRRGSLLRLLAGVLLTVGGCMAVAWMDDDAAPDAVAALATGVPAAGLVLLLNGLVRLALVEGARYAADKVQERLDDDY